MPRAPWRTEYPAHSVVLAPAKLPWTPDRPGLKYRVDVQFRDLSAPRSTSPHAHRLLGRTVEVTRFVFDRERMKC